MGASRLLRATWQKCQSPGWDPPENPGKIIYFHGFFMDFLVKTHSKTSGKPVRSFWTGLSLPRPLPAHFTSILHLSFFFEKILFFFSSFCEVFPIFSLFVELRRLWDHSQIVDLIFLIRMVSTRASETSKTPHSWQNNVPKHPKSFFDFFKVFPFFYYFLSPGGSGTTPKL